MSTAPDPVRLFAQAHRRLLKGNAYTYAEVAYTRATGWMAWLCTNAREADPNRQVLAKGQGATMREACRRALKELKV